MKYLAFIILFLVFFSACTHRGSGHRIAKIKPCGSVYATDTMAFYVIAANDTMDARPMYHVVFPDGKVLERMYAEEIAGSLLQGKWGYNEDWYLSK